MAYTGAHAKSSPSRGGKRPLLTLISLLLVVCLAVGGTMAFLKADSGAVTNSFTVAPTPSPEVTEDFNGTVKTNVAVNTGTEYSCYVRAKVLITWQDENGNSLAQAPVAGTDYSITYGSDNWVLKEDGCWYYKTPVAGATDVLITECKQLKAAPVGGYTLCVEIFSQTVQSSPVDAIKETWLITPDAAGNIA